METTMARLTCAVTAESANSGVKSKTAGTPLIQELHYQAHLAVGRLLNCVHLYPAAERHLQQAVLFSPQRPEGYLHLGTAIEGQGLFGPASRCYRFALVVDEKNAAAQRQWLRLQRVHPQAVAEFAVPHAAECPISHQPEASFMDQA